ncbi:MAG: ATP-dependent DNA helicase RecG [Inconstantimicrobium porci]|uniref:ATP-dependent DNA helicase RecG n=1 Tax=Inconstantimicrobium porci TaxID=2652291 RepID=A0A7X2MW10_9CLOT|nr:ATP-dependent DNA helicase RecG [Inconstantimicrobium porci]MDD6772126.1 ATP-dependent DNA helicase RecG [Inconstantimicrobium porci]MDY5911249.1 ATP-dependent DNA helicase RecG [Inconstantimicrobium porci]MSR90118.1 ATP-dependent DNA helicase RecG [Inconstantimicrobium porci]
MNLYDDVKFIKGVGPKFEEKLNKCGIFNALDLLLYFPRDYDYIEDNMSIESIDENEKIILTCRVCGIGKTYRTNTRKLLSQIIFTYNDVTVVGKWFNSPYVVKSFKDNETYNLLGKFKRIGNRIEVINPQIVNKECVTRNIVPIYPLKGDLTSKSISKIINNVFNEISIEENLPAKILKKYNLCSLEDAIKEIHFPSSKVSLQRSIQRLKFQELFNYSMKLLILKDKFKHNNSGIAFKISDELALLKEKLPFTLTKAQSKVVREILIDEKKHVPMNRLVQGDVGSGKTIVAIIAMFNVYKNGYQSVMMAPTEILAMQHYEEVKKILSPFDVDIELLTGSTSAKEKKRIKEKIRLDMPVIVVGTHAVIQEDVVFGKLGMAVTDEQHRFGVQQRNRITSSNNKADVLVMTATPIPRTLALYLYSDLDISIIDELPPGRKRIITEYFREQSRDDAYKKVHSELQGGRQAYIVCPLIEEDTDKKLNSVESLYNELSQGILSNFKVEIMHGKLKPKEKDEIITRFKNKEIDVLISTTVIEVGVNVPNASCMVIENSERFGLAQLHQLRGRVGRGKYQSYCFLIANIKSKTTQRRMEIMTESTDGFYISEQDFKLRGTGEMFGFRQHGDSGLLLADFIEDIDILKAAFKEAGVLLSSEAEEIKKLCMSLEKSLVKSSRFICFN